MYVTHSHSHTHHTFVGVELFLMGVSAGFCTGSLGDGRAVGILGALGLVGVVAGGAVCLGLGCASLSTERWISTLLLRRLFSALFERH